MFCVNIKLPHSLQLLQENLSLAFHYTSLPTSIQAGEFKIIDLQTTSGRELLITDYPTELSEFQKSRAGKWIIKGICHPGEVETVIRV